MRIIEIKESVFADNDREAAALRGELKEKGLFLLNLMSSPGSGKTTTLVSTLRQLGGELRVGVMEADIDSSLTGKICGLLQTILPIPKLLRRRHRTSSIPLK